MLHAYTINCSIAKLEWQEARHASFHCQCLQTLSLSHASKNYNHKLSLGLLHRFALQLWCCGANSCSIDPILL